MKSNLKEVIKKNILDISVKNLTDNDIKNVFILKRDDDFDLIVSRFNIGLANSLANNINIDTKINNHINESDISAKIFFYNKILSSGNVSEADDFKAKYLNNIDEITNISLELENLEYQLNLILKESDITPTILKLQELDKKVLVFFNNVNYNVKFFGKINNLRNIISNEIFNFKLRNIKNSKDKKQELIKICTEYKDYLNKKQSIISNINVKVLENITKQQNKLLLNVQKLRHPDLTKNIQLYLKLNVELSKIYDKFIESKNITSEFNLIYPQIMDRVNAIKTLSESINRIATKTILEDIKDYLSLFNCLYYYKDRVIELKSLSNIDMENVLTLVENINKDNRSLKSIHLNNHSNCTYFHIKSYLENILKDNHSTNIIITINSSFVFPIFSIKNEFLSYGNIYVKVNKLKNNFRVEYCGKYFYSKENKLKDYKINYISNDTDDISKNVLEIVKSYDFLKSIKV